MFERFTDRARRVVVHAQEEARLLRHSYIGTEHVLLGLIHEGDGVAARALANLGISRDGVRQQVEEIVGQGEETPSGHIPFTPRAKKVLELSLREALHLKHNYIGTEHILLGLLREGEGVAAQVLVRLGADLDRVRRQVVRLLVGDSGAESSPPPDQPPRTPAAAEVLAAAEQLAGGSPVGSQHLLEALARSERSLAANALTAVGVDVELLAAKLDELGPEGTTDLTPEEEAARHTEIRLDGDEVTVVLRDPATVEQVRAVTEQLGGPVRGDDPLTGGLVGVHQAVLRCLNELQHRLSPPAEPPEPDSAGRISTLLQRATQSRLHRRSR